MGDLTSVTDDVTLWNDGKTKAVTVTTDGGKERLDVNSVIEGGSFQLGSFVPRLVVDSTGVVLSTGSWTSLLSITAAGKLDFIATSAGSSSYRIRLTVDGTEVYDLAMSDLAAIGLSNASNVEMWAETANKNFRYHPKEGPDFTTSLLIEAQSTVATPTLASLITYRETV